MSIIEKRVIPTQSALQINNKKYWKEQDHTYKCMRINMRGNFSNWNGILKKC